MQAGTLPNETLVLTSSGQFRLLHKKRLVSQGIYYTGRESVCNGQLVDRDELILEPTAVGAFTPGGVYTVRGDTLVLDGSYYSCASEASTYTYQRVP